MTADALYLYGIVAAGHHVPAELRGVGAPPAVLELLTAGPVAAVVSDPPARLRARRRDLMAHQDVLLTLAHDGPVLPMRFGMTAPSAEAVRGRLEAGLQRYPRVLDRLVGRVEMNVKARPASGALAAVIGQEPRIRQLRDAARRRPGYEANLRLGEAVAHALTRRAADAAQDAVRELTALAVADSRGPDVVGCVRNASFLVARQDIRAFQSVVEYLSGRCRDRVELRVIGPLPCYSFTEPTGAAAATVRAGG
jgi:Gas vesicle synthesis protein GvpL/GvpF